MLPMIVPQLMTAQEIGCFPELPEEPYPPSLNVREVGSRGPDGRIAILGYNDQWGEREYLYTFTDLCDRAGCRCVGNRVVCSNWGILFVPDFYHWYRNRCLHLCECFEENSDLFSDTASEAASDSSSETWSSLPNVNKYKTDWAAKNAQTMRLVYNPTIFANVSQNGRSIEHSAPPVASMVPNRLNGGKPCLAGQAAGWTFKNFARGQCCPGYGFHALTASELYVNYGLPVGDVVAGVSIVGICLKPISG